MADKKEKREKEDKVPIVIKSAVDLQRLKLEKLMKNPVSLTVPERTQID